MGRMDELWQFAGGPGLAPETDARTVKARVNAALDADPAERSIHMKQKLRCGLAVAALVAAVTTSALAVGTNWDVLSVFFRGDTAPAQDYVDNTPRTVSDENYTLTVESAVTDEKHIYLVASVTALSDEAKAFLHDEFFVDMDTWWVRSAETAAYLQENPQAVHIPVPRIDGFGGGELPSSQEDTRRFNLYGSFKNGVPTSILFRLHYMDESAVLELPVSPAPCVTVELGVSGLGVLEVGCLDLEPDPLTIQQVTLTPFSCAVETSPESTLSAIPNLRFRMADGSIRTQAQMMTPTDSAAGRSIGQTNNVFNYRFYEVQELDAITSIIAFDMEYPLDGSAPKAVAHDAALDPFTVPLTDQLRTSLGEGGGIPIPVRALAEGLGGTCEWDSATGAVTCTFRGVSVVLTPGSKTVTVDGQARELREAPQARYVDGTWVTVAPWYVFEKAWGLNGFVTYTQGDPLEFPDGHSEVPLDYHDWYVIP